MSELSVAYLEFLTMSILKDIFSMMPLHQLMHVRFYSLHKTHHISMREVSVVNVFFFDYVDLTFENAVGPLMLLASKALLGFGLQMHAASIIILFVGEILVHSCSPFTVFFFNPLLDGLMNCNVSHNLHHALNKDNYMVWPLHQLSAGGLDKSVEQYDATFRTNISSGSHDAAKADAAAVGAR